MDHQTQLYFQTVTSIVQNVLGVSAFSCHNRAQAYKYKRKQTIHADGFTK